MSLENMVQDAASGLFVPTQARRQVIPYDDLQALNPPVTNPEISPSIVPTVATVSAQGPRGPKLLQATDYASMHVAAQVSFTCKVTAPTPLNGQDIQVDDPTFVRAGAWFWLIQAPANGGNQSGPYFAFPTADPHVIHIGIPLTLAANIGDILFSVPQVNLIGGSNNVIVGVDQIFVYPGGTGSPDGNLSAITDPVGRLQLRTDATRTHDLFLSGPNVSNAAINLDFAAPGAGRRLQLSYVCATVASTAANGADELDIWKGGIGVGTKIAAIELYCFKVGDSVHFETDKIKLVGDVNGKLGCALTATAASIFHSLHIGAVVLSQ